MRGTRTKKLRDPDTNPRPGRNGGGVVGLDPNPGVSFKPTGKDRTAVKLEGRHTANVADTVRRRRQSAGHPAARAAIRAEVEQAAGIAQQIARARASFRNKFSGN